MTQTTSAINACDVDVKIDDPGGSLVDIAGSSNSLDVSFDIQSKAFRSFGSEWPARLTCGKDASFTLQAIYSSANDEAWDVLKSWYFSVTPNRRTFEFYIPSNTAGADKFTSEVRIESLSWSMSPDEAGPIMVTAMLKPDGEVVHSIVAS